jgi:hypothetical protein
LLGAILFAVVVVVVEVEEDDEEESKGAVEVSEPFFGGRGGMLEEEDDDDDEDEEEAVLRIRGLRSVCFLFSKVIPEVDKLFIKFRDNFRFIVAEKSISKFSSTTNRGWEVEGEDCEMGVEGEIEVGVVGASSKGLRELACRLCCGLGGTGGGFFTFVLEVNVDEFDDDDEEEEDEKVGERGSSKGFVDLK